MEISESSAARVRRTADPPAASRRQPSTTADAAATDSIEVSPEARALAGVDDLTRARRVQQLRAQVDAGTYTVDPTEVARRMAERGEA